MKALYIDTSAALKQLRQEAETAAYLAYITGARADGVALTSSVLLDVELARVGVRDGYPAARVEAVLSQFVRRQIGPAIVAQVAAFPFHLRSLDAIHLATAVLLGSDLAAVVTYDRQMTRAAQQLGLPIAQPGIGLAPANDMRCRPIPASDEVRELIRAAM